MPKFQTPTQRSEIDRTKHVWVQMKPTGYWKCVLCGGLTKNPTDFDLPEKFEKLTDEERACCRARR